MTCREFKRAAASQTLWELARPDNERMFDHAGECAGCAAWLEQQQMLAAGMQALQAETAACEAGPHVEQALLRLFRQETVKANHPVAARGAPVAFGLSRFFEVGAYAAVAAAIVVGLFLGARLLERRSATASVQNQSVPAATAPAQQVHAAGNVSPQAVASAMPEARALSGKPEVAGRSVSRNDRNRHSSAAASEGTDDPDFVALMFCDPLICSSDTQVVRMELPVAESGDRDAQTQVADVVVGDDGLVRAMRIVN